jgi:alkanesulfonate monooxygenase SsuD/methylene tetrahydromethanopterin reductase-like flavin-dependent oxidoreductase (luciferase family)
MSPVSTKLRYGFVFPLSDARSTADMAAIAESVGWDAIFVADSPWGIDPWVTLAAVAMRTNTLRFGTMLTPLSRRRPWKLASETATLDNLSNGRLILSVGLGAIDTGFEAFGEKIDRKTRAELLDEGLDIVTGLWHGQPFAYDGKHYHIQPTTFFPPPPPVQTPRIPIWVVGSWPRERSMARVLRYDGLLPAKISPDGQFEYPTADDLRAMVTYLAERRTLTKPLDVVMEGRTSGDPADKQAAVDKILPYAEAGATWWLESMWMAPNSPEDVLRRIRQGPPSIG